MLIILSQILVVLTLSGIAILFYQAIVRQDLKNIVQQIGVANQSSIVQQIGVAGQSSVIGLVEVLPDSSAIDFSSLMLESHRLVIVLNDGRTWASVHRDRLRKRFADQTKETTIFLIHPDSQMVNVLARKGSVEPSIIQQRIYETVQLLKEISQPFTSLEILGHYLFNPHSMLLGDATAIVIPYFASRGGRTVPAFRYQSMEGECYFKELFADMERLRMDSINLRISRSASSSLINLDSYRK